MVSNLTNSNIISYAINRNGTIQVYTSIPKSFKGSQKEYLGGFDQLTRAEQKAEGLYDVDKDGDTTALGDGLLIFRSLNRDSFLEENLIKGAISDDSPYFNHEKPWESILNNIALLETYDNII